MTATFLSNAQITSLAQTLTEATLGRSANSASSQARLATMVAARIGPAKSAAAMTEVLACTSLEAAKTILAARIAGIEAETFKPRLRIIPTEAPAQLVIAPRLNLERMAGPEAEPRKPTKQAALIAMLRAPNGASMDEIVAATGWQQHTVRGAMAGALRKKLGLDVASARIEGRGRVYSLPAA